MVVALANELMRRGESVAIYTLSYDREETFGDQLEDIPIVSLDVSTKKPSKRDGRFTQYARYFLNLYRENNNAKKLALLIDPATEILNPHDQVSYRVAYFFKKKVRQVPSVWTMHDMPTKLWFYWRERQFDPSITISPIKYLFAWLCDKYDILKYIRRQDVVLVLGERDREWVRRDFKKDAIIIRNGLDVELFPYKSRAINAVKTGLLTMNGIFFNHRRFEDCLIAVAQLRKEGFDLRVVITGDTDADRRYTARIRALIQSLGLAGHVILTGRVDHETLVKSYQESDMFVFPNNLQSWGLAPFEAMACGTPVIVSRGAGASEVLRDGEHALLVDPEQPEQIATAIKRLLTDEALYRKLSQQGREFVEKTISWERYAESMIQIFRKTLAHIL